MNDLERDLRRMFKRREADLREPRFAAAHVPSPVLRRTRRHQVGVVLAAVAVVAALAIGSTAAAVSLLRSSERRVPANPDETPTSSLLAPVRRPDLDGPWTIRAAGGEAEGNPWGIWASEDLRCLAFANANGVVDAGCGDGYDGSDLMHPNECESACRVVGRSVLYGLASARVAAVLLAVDDGTTYGGTIHPSPPEVTSDARLYTVVTDGRWGTSFTGTLTAMGADGSVLGQVRYPSNADAAGGWSMPMSVEATLASGVPVNEVDGGTSEADRWEISVWRNASDDWCLGTIFPNAAWTTDRSVGWIGIRELPSALVATEGRGCGPRGELFQGIRSGAVGHADIWSIEGPVLGDRWGWAYRASGTASDDVASVRLEVGDGQAVDATLYDPPPGFEDMGRLFVAEFFSKDHPRGAPGAPARVITWRAVALGANGEVLGTDEITL